MRFATRSAPAAWQQELGWLPYQVQDIGRLTSVEADRLSVLASCWRADAAQLEADAPTDEDLRDVEFLSTHFNDDVGGCNTTAPCARGAPF